MARPGVVPHAAMFDRCSITPMPISRAERFPRISGGDDGTRTHDPLLANEPTQDGYERLRTRAA
jgi:hypothetical protein